jgi:hypothetical protein
LAVSEGIVWIHNDEEIPTPANGILETHVAARFRPDLGHNERVEPAHGHRRRGTRTKDARRGALDFRIHRCPDAPVGSVASSTEPLRSLDRHRNFAYVRVDSDLEIGAMR